MKLVVTMRVLPKIYFSGAENRFSVHTAVREIFGGHFPWERYFFFLVQNFFPGTIFFLFYAFHKYIIVLLKNPMVYIIYIIRQIRAFEKTVDRKGLSGLF